jgi:hypothetical protein
MMKVMRTTVNVNEGMIEKARSAAVGRGVTLGELVEDALRTYLSRSEEVAPPPFELHTVRGELVDPNLDLNRTSALVTLDDESAYGKSQ